MVEGSLSVVVNQDHYHYTSEIVVVVVVVGKLIYPSSGVMSYHSVSVYSFFER